MCETIFFNRTPVFVKILIHRLAIYDDDRTFSQDSTPLHFAWLLKGPQTTLLLKGAPLNNFRYYRPSQLAAKRPSLIKIVITTLTIAKSTLVP